MATKARKAVDKAAKAVERAREALAAISEFIPAASRDLHHRWVHDLGEYGAHLSGVTWPDKMGDR